SPSRPRSAGRSTSSPRRSNRPRRRKPGPRPVCRHDHGEIPMARVSVEEFKGVMNKSGGGQKKAVTVSAAEFAELKKKTWEATQGSFSLLTRMGREAYEQVKPDLDKLPPLEDA